MIFTCTPKSKRFSANSYSLRELLWKTCVSIFSPPLTQYRKANSCDLSVKVQYSKKNPYHLKLSRSNSYFSKITLNYLLVSEIQGLFFQRASTTETGSHLFSFYITRENLIGIVDKCGKNIFLMLLIQCICVVLAAFWVLL